MNIPTILAEVFLFQSLSTEQYQTLATHCHIQTYKKGAHLFSEGDPGKAFYLIVSGRVKIYRISPDGMEHTIQIVGKQEIVAEVVISEFQTYPANCEALEHTTALEIPTHHFRQFILAEPEIALKMMSAYAHRVRHLLAVIEDLTFRDVKARLARYILQHCHSNNCSQDQICQLHYSKKELAALLGTIPETLSRTLQKFKEMGLIEVDNRAIIIKDINQLQALAEPF